MKKKIIIIIAIILLLFIPIPFKLKDGGSIEYRAILYNVTKINKYNEQSTTGYEYGWKVKILGIQVYNKTTLETSKDVYELIVDRKMCYNCYMEIYEFDDGTKIYGSCPNVTYKTNNIEISLSEAINKELLGLSELEEHGFQIVKPNQDTCSSCCQ